MVRLLIVVMTTVLTSFVHFDTTQYHTRITIPTHTRRFTSFAMSTAFEPSLSMSAVRPPLSSANAPSMADSLPNINFGFEELRDRMAKFTVRFDSFIEQGRKRVLEERNQFRMNVTELHGRFFRPSPTDPN